MLAIKMSFLDMLIIIDEKCIYEKKKEYNAEKSIEDGIKITNSTVGEKFIFRRDNH